MLPFPNPPPPLNTDGRPCQMWSNHPFNQKNKATKRAVRVEIGRGGGVGLHNI